MKRVEICGIGIALVFLLLPTWVSADSQAQEFKATGPWQAKGVAYQIGDQKYLFVGVFSGITVLEKKGEVFDAAEFTCPSTQEIDYSDGTSKSSGYCIFETSGANRVFASWHCEGAVDTCDGVMDFKAGTGAMEGIRGGGAMQIRSFFLDVSDTEEGEAVIDKAIGVVSWPELRVRIGDG